MKREIVVVTAAYGWDKVNELGGQANLLPIIAQSGADGVEIRRELLSQAELQTLGELAKQIARQQLFAVYSVPEGLFAPDGSLNPALEQRLHEAIELNARLVKFALGHYQPGYDFTALNALLKKYDVPLVVENDQTADCGTLSPLNAFFAAVQDSHSPIRMTFDMANWDWVNEYADIAAQKLAHMVHYVHVKAAEKRAQGWCAVELDNSDGRWKPLLSQLPNQVMRGIEFPLEGDDLTAVTRHYVNLLRVN